MIGFILALGLVHAEGSPSEDAPVESPVMVEYGVIPEDVARIARAVVNEPIAYRMKALSEPFLVHPY